MKHFRVHRHNEPEIDISAESLFEEDAGITFSVYSDNNALAGRSINVAWVPIAGISSIVERHEEKANG